MKIDCIADTHAKHSQLDLEGGDILIHAGDIEARNKEMLINFLGWFQKQPYQHKIFIAGNHDGWMQTNPGRVKYILNRYDTIYLQDEFVTINDIKIWGSPWSKEFGGWSFMKSEHAMHEHVNKMPTFMDIVIQHGPPLGILDEEKMGNQCGSEALRYVKCDYYICGHIHEQGGKTKEDGGRTYINCSVVDRQLNVNNEPITIHI